MAPPPVTVVGGGLAGLVAAITAAEAGSTVDLHEAHPMLGGRARSTQGPFVANLGPHALYCDGPLWRWLVDRSLLPPVASPPTSGFRLRYEGTARRVPPPSVVAALLRLRRKEAPVDEAFRPWATRVVGERAAAALSSAAGVFTCVEDPGTLSAAFVHERLVRVTSSVAARYPIGGWSSLVASLEAGARARGVRIHLSSRVDTLPEGGPVVVATTLEVARTLLGDESLRWTGASTALLDVGLTARRGDPFIVSDLDGAGWAERFSRPDPSLAPAGHSLVQAHVGASSLDEGVARLEALLDSGFAGWRSREVWRRRSLVKDSSGAVDLPGTSWRDRPAVDRGDGVFLCGDMVAAPGLFSEVSWASGVEAGAQSSRRTPRSPAQARSAT